MTELGTITIGPDQVLDPWRDTAYPTVGGWIVESRPAPAPQVFGVRVRLKS